MHLGHVEVAVVAEAVNAVLRQALVEWEAHFDGVAPLQAGPPQARHHVAQAADLGSRKQEGGGAYECQKVRAGQPSRQLGLERMPSQSSSIHCCASRAENAMHRRAQREKR